MKTTASKMLPIIIVSQFFCTSLWFGSNAVLADLSAALHLSSSALASVTSLVQFGFITGTLVYALFTIADRFEPSKVFFWSAVAASLSNACIILTEDYSVVLLCRFLTGFFLAGIYPVGMKIASDYYEKGLSKALGLLVGALVLGTSFPHLLKSLSLNLSWKTVLAVVSLMTLTGGSLILFFVPAGPFRKPMQRPHFTAALEVFKPNGFKSAAFGYFGHMWELYTFWAFVPFMLSTYNQLNHTSLPVSLSAFIVVASGCISCAVAGVLSKKINAKRIAAIALTASGICCIISPVTFNISSTLFIAFLVFWGFVVVADSPMFSSLIAHSALPQEKGTALTIATCIGFFITIVSISLLNQLQHIIEARWVFVFLAPGPLLGLAALWSYKDNQ